MFPSIKLYIYVLASCGNLNHQNPRSVEIVMKETRLLRWNTRKRLILSVTYVRDLCHACTLVPSRTYVTFITPVRELTASVTPVRELMHVWASGPLFLSSINRNSRGMRKKSFGVRFLVPLGLKLTHIHQILEDKEGGRARDWSFQLDFIINQVY